jgi:hypothetical protein
MDVRDVTYIVEFFNAYYYNLILRKGKNHAYSNLYSYLWVFRDLLYFKWRPVISHLCVTVVFAASFCYFSVLKRVFRAFLQFKVSDNCLSQEDSCFSDVFHTIAFHL